MKPLVSVAPTEEYVWISKAIDLDVFRTHSHPIMHRLGQEWGVQVTIAGSPGLSIEDEPYIKAIYDAIERRAAGIMVHGWGSAAEVDAINAAIEHGIPVITVDSDVPNSKRLAHVGTDWFRMGGAMADQIAGLIGNKGKVLVIGNVSLTNLNAGYRGIYERMKAYPDIEVFGPEDDSRVDITREITTRWLKTHPDITGIVGLGSLTGPAIANVLEEMGLAGQVKVVCVDAEAAHIDDINKGTIQVAFSQRREFFTYQAFQMLYAYNHGSAVTGYQPGSSNISGSIDTGFTIVTKWNADSFKDEFSLEETIDHIRLSRRLSLMSTAVESSGQIILVVDSEDEIVYANPTAVRTSGLPEKQIMGLSLTQFFDLTEDNLASINQCRAAGIAVSFETYTHQADDQRIPIQFSVSPLKDDSIRNGLVITATDITERQRATDSLREQQQFLQFVLDNIPARVFWKDTGSKFLGCNRLFAQDMGLNSPDEIIGKGEWFAKSTYVDLYHKDDREVMESGLPLLNYEEPFMSADGQHGWLQTSKVPLKDSTGKLIGILGIFSHITERKAMEQALRLTQFSIDRASIGITRIGKQAEILDANPYFCDLLGYTKEELTKLHIYEIDPDYPFERWKANRVGVEQQRTHIFETRHRRKDGRILPVEITSTYLTFQGDDFVVSFVRDISEQKKTLEALRMMSFAVENASDAVYWIGEDTRFIEVNPAACQMLGYTHDELVTMSVSDIDPLKSLNEIKEILRNLSQGESQRFETQHKTKAGHIFPVEVVANSFIYDGKVLSCAFVRDISEQKRTLEALLFKSFVVENSPDAVYWIDSNLKFTDVNDAACKMLGYSRDELLTMSTKDVNAERSLDQLNEIWDQTQKYGSLRFETLHRTKSGRIFPVEALISHITYEGKRLNCAFVRDISERKQIEDELKNRETLLNEAQQFSHVGSWDMDIPSGKVRWTDESFRLFGFQPNEVQPTFEVFLSRIHPDDHHLIMTQLQEIRTLKVFNPLTYRVLLPDNSIRWIQNSGTVILDERGNAMRLVGMQQDITERKLADEALKRSENRFRVLVENSPDYITFLDSEFKIQYINRVAQGNSNDYFIGKNILDFALPQFVDMSVDLFERVLKTGKLEQHEIAGRSIHGDVVWYSNRVVPVYEDGQGANLMLVTSDITDRKRAENELHSNEERLRQVVRVGNIGIFDHDHRDDSIYWSPEIRTIYGWGMDEEVPLSAVRDAVYPADEEAITKAVINAWDPLGNGAYDVEYRIVRRNGQVIWISTRSLTFFEGEGEARHPVRTIGATADITKQKEIEASIRASEKSAREFQEKLKALQEISFELTSAESIDGLCSKAVTLGCSILGYERLELGMFKDQERKIVSSYGIDEVGQLRVIHHGTLDPNDTVVADILTSPNVSFVNEDADLHDDRHNTIGHGWNVICGVWGKDNSIGWLAADNLIHHAPLVSYQVELLKLYGLTIGHLIIRKQAELEIYQLNEALERRVIERTRELQEANEEIKNFAYIVSHDLRAPLVNLKGFAAELRSSLTILENDCHDLLPSLERSKQERLHQTFQEDIPEALQYIESSVSGMDSFTKAILKLSRLGRLQLEIIPVDTQSIVNKTLETLGYQISQQNIQVTLGNLPKIYADVVAMEQIFGNILANAVAYLEPNRRGEIEVSAEVNANEILFSVRDNGRGIAKEDMGKVFAPFRRAGKQDVPGEGMGLAYVQTLVRRHGGRIWCESTPHVGTTFFFTISKHLLKEVNP